MAIELKLFIALQKSIPTVKRPFLAIAEELGMTETEVLAEIEVLRSEGKIRRFGGVFDSRRLGYKSSLFAIKTTPETIDEIAADICSEGGVTHAYTRGWPQDFTWQCLGNVDYRAYPDFWYTLSAPSDKFDEISAKFSKWNPVPFPATKRFKIDVLFNPETRNRDEITEHKPQKNFDSSVENLTPKQIDLVRVLQDDVPICSEFFKRPFELAGWDETEAFEQLRAWQDSGVLRRISMLLYHRTNGFIANGMCCWNVAKEDIDKKGRLLAECSEVTHCYERPINDVFPFTLYAMIHETSWTRGCETFEKLARKIHEPNGRIFFSLKEFKKTSVRFF